MDHTQLIRALGVAVQDGTAECNPPHLTFFDDAGKIIASGMMSVDPAVFPGGISIHGDLTVENAGTATQFVLHNGEGGWHMSGSVGMHGSWADLTIDNNQMSKSTTITINFSISVGNV